MTIHELALRYKRCSLEEVQQFVAQRTGNFRRMKNKATCVRKLKQLDHDTTFPFRFLDLLPELRNRVYKNLLQYDNGLLHKDDVFRKTIYAHPAILRACRQIYNEACGLLYAQSKLRLMVCHESFITTGPKMAKLRNTFKWQGSISRYPRNVILNVGTLSFEHSEMKRVFEDLVQSHGEENALATLKIFTSEQQTFAIDLEQFAPLCALPAATKLEFIGFPEQMEADIRVRIVRPSK